MTDDPRLAYLLERYGVRMRLEDAARELGMALATAHRQRQRGAFPVPTFAAGRDVWVDTVDLAAHQADVAAEARRRHAALQESLSA